MASDETDDFLNRKKNRAKLGFEPSCCGDTVDSSPQYAMTHISGSTGGLKTVNVCTFYRKINFLGCFSMMYLKNRILDFHH